MNTLTDYLHTLGVRFTHSYADKRLATHPWGHSMLGLSKLLEEYKVKSVGIKTEDKESVSLPLPYIAHMGSMFVVVSRADEQSVTYLRCGKAYTIPQNNFVKYWDGIALIGEADDHSVEPNYKQHLYQERWQRLYRLALVAVSIVLLIGAFVMNGSIRSVSMDITFILSALGVYICVLLWKKQRRLHSAVGDAICNLFHHKDCTGILDSKAAFVMGFSWSEIGFGYFLANLLILSLVPQCYGNLLCANLCVLPYTFWSIGYQAKTKNWCMLCVIVQLLLWAQFVCGLLLWDGSVWGCFAHPSLQKILAICCFYMLGVLAIHVFSDGFGNSRDAEDSERRLAALKADEDVFKSLLRRENYYAAADESQTSIQWGNLDSKFRITIFSNPYCNPCAHMHEQVDELLAQAGDKVCVRYFLTAFQESLEQNSRHLIAIAQNHTQGQSLKIFDEWYAGGKQHAEDFQTRYPYSPDADAVLAEWNEHVHFAEQTQLTGTPTVLINGYIKPSQYSISDLQYLLDAFDSEE